MTKLTNEQLEECIEALVQLEDDSLEDLLGYAAALLWSRLPLELDGRKYKFTYPNASLTVFIGREDE